MHAHVCVRKRDVSERERELLSAACMKSAAEERGARGIGGGRHIREKKSWRRRRRKRNPLLPLNAHAHEGERRRDERGDGKERGGKISSSPYARTHACGRRGSASLLAMEIFRRDRGKRERAMRHSDGERKFLSLHAHTCTHGQKRERDEER